MALKSEAEESLGEKKILGWAEFVELDNDEKLEVVHESLEGVTKRAKVNAVGMAKTSTILRGMLNSQETNLETVEASVAGIRGLVTIIEGAICCKLSLGAHNTLIARKVVSLLVCSNTELGIRIYVLSLLSR